MSTTTRQAYRRSHQPAAGTVDVTRDAGRCDCGQHVTLEELFSHDCPNDTRRMRQVQRVAADVHVTTGRRDSLDVPEWRGGAGGHSPARRRQRGIENRYAGSCAVCEAHVGIAEGRAIKLDGRWVTLCVAHQGLDDDHVRDARADRVSEQLTDSSRRSEESAGREQGCRPNRYAGDCRFCGSHVPAGSGLLCRVDGSWAVEHKAGQCSPSTGHTAAAPAALADVAEGHYAIDSTGHNDLAFYRVDRPTEGEYAGRTFVKLVVGGKPDRNVRRDHVAGILERIAADSREASRRYAAEIRRCAKCNRKLTDETSRRDADVNGGFGPECVKHVGF